MKARVIFEVYDDEDRLVHTETSPIRTMLPIYENANLEKYEISFRYCQLKDPIYICHPAEDEQRRETTNETLRSNR